MDWINNNPQPRKYGELRIYYSSKLKVQKGITLYFYSFPSTQQLANQISEKVKSSIGCMSVVSESCDIHPMIGDPLLQAEHLLHYCGGGKLDDHFFCYDQNGLEQILTDLSLKELELFANKGDDKNNLESISNIISQHVPKNVKTKEGYMGSKWQ